LSSTTPTIVTKDGKVVITGGASGGSIIPTATSQVLLDVLSFTIPLGDSVSRPRLHHQLFPDYIRTEKDFPSDVVKGLEERHHDVQESTGPLAVVQAINRNDDGSLTATSD
jgi:gamma-glutamyltranspeptidase